MSEQFEQKPNPEQEKSLHEKVLEFRERLKVHPEGYQIGMYIIPDFVGRLKKEFPDHSKYQLYHDLAGSTPFEDAILIQDDFPGEYSIEKFIEQFS